MSVKEKCPDCVLDGVQNKPCEKHLEALRVVAKRGGSLGAIYDEIHGLENGRECDICGGPQVCTRHDTCSTCGAPIEPRECVSRGYRQSHAEDDCEGWERYTRGFRAGQRVNERREKEENERSVVYVRKTEIGAAVIFSAGGYSFTVAETAGDGAEAHCLAISRQFEAALGAVRGELLEEAAQYFERPMHWTCLDHGGEEVEDIALRLRNLKVPTEGRE